MYCAILHTMMMKTLCGLWSSLHEDHRPFIVCYTPLYPCFLSLFFFKKAKMPKEIDHLK